MAGTIYGYIRVSTREQNEDRQRLALAALLVPKENIYMDKQSGKDVYKRQCLGNTIIYCPNFPSAL